MRTLLIILSFSLAFAVQGQGDVGSSIAKAVETGNVEGLAKYFTSSVDLTVLSKEDVYPGDQAEKILKDFFAKNPAKSFEIKHKGTSKLDDEYRIGDLVTEKGKYRVTFFMKNTPKGKKIRQFRIEEFDDDF